MIRRFRVHVIILGGARYLELDSVRAMVPNLNNRPEFGRWFIVVM